MDTKIDFLYLSEPDMIKAGVKDMSKCVDCMEDLLVTLNKGDYMMGGENHNSHGCMIMFPDDPKFPGMPKNGPDRRFMAMPAYLGGKHQLAGMKWYGSNIENKEKGLPRSILMMMLNDKDTGAPLALMSANLLSSYRTGGCPGKDFSGGIYGGMSEPRYAQGKRQRCQIPGKLCCMGQIGISTVERHYYLQGQ